MTIFGNWSCDHHPNTPLHGPWQVESSLSCFSSLFGQTRWDFLFWMDPEVDPDGSAYLIHHSYFFRLAIIWLLLNRLPYLELDPGPWKHCPPSSPPSPNFSWFFGYFLAIFGLITIFGSPPPIKSKPNEKLMKSSQWKGLTCNEKPMKSTGLQWKVIWKFYRAMKS